MRLFLGNIVGLISSLIMIYSGSIKDKKRIVFVQGIQISVYSISCLILGGITGVVVSVINLFRNILCYKEKLGIKEKVLISVLSISISIYFNNLGLLGYCPLIGTITYLWFMDIKDVVKFKYLIIFTMSTWSIYNFIIKSYTTMVFNIITIIVSIISIIKIKRMIK